jgi:hypothetical protein
MLILKILAVSITFIVALGMWIIAWRRVPESKKDQRIMIYIAGFLSLIMGALMLFFGPG